MLADLKAEGCRLGGASSKPEFFVKKILEYFEIDGYFDAVVGSELNGTRVKKDEVVQEALKRLFGEAEVQYDRTVMVGDRKFDVIGAKAMGLHSVGVRYGYAQGSELEESGADHVASDVKELCRILLA